MRTPVGGCCCCKPRVDIPPFITRLSSMTLLFLVSAVFSSVAVCKPTVKLVVEAGQHTRIDTPVS
ncbi:MAG: hypothetical protein ACYSTZ_07095, partial [Planctomycetota bacterium]